MEEDRGGHLDLFIIQVLRYETDLGAEIRYSTVWRLLPWTFVDSPHEIVGIGDGGKAIRPL
jgi:hypothetical protein